MSIENMENITQKKPIKETIDLSEAWDKESTRDIVINRLKDLGIYQPNLLYKGFDGDEIEVVKQSGTDKPEYPAIYCSKESDLLGDCELDQSAIEIALDFDKAGLAVYDGEKLEQIEHELYYKYKVKKNTKLEDTLVAVFLLE